MATMFCPSCCCDVEIFAYNGERACPDCGVVLDGGPSVYTAAFARRSNKPEKIHKSVASVISERGDGLSQNDREALARVAQASVVAAFAGARAPAAAARSLAKRVHAEIETRVECDVMRKAESIVAAVDARATGKSREAGQLLIRAREAHGACTPSPQMSEGVWALAAIAAATCGPPHNADFGKAAQEAVIRCDLPLKGACFIAIQDVWKFGMELS